MNVNVNQRAPSFEMILDSTLTCKLEDFQGKRLILFFYPKDDTPGCTLESCAFRDHYDEIKNLATEVIGISKDSVKSHQKFKQKYNLSYPLASDPQGEIAQLYGIWVQKKMFTKTYYGMERSTFLIDENGILIQKWLNVNPLHHIKDVMEFLKKGCHKI